MVKRVEYEKKDVPDLKYGVIHSQIGFSDGVSIVMGQVENVLNKNLKVPKKTFFILLVKQKWNLQGLAKKRFCGTGIKLIG